MKKETFNTQVIFLLVLAILLVIFTLQNSVSITVTLFFWKINNIPLVLLILCSVLLGYLIPYLSLLPRVWRLKRELARAKTENEQLQNENAENTSKTKPHPEGIAFEEEPDEEENRFFRE